MPKQIFIRRFSLILKRLEKGPATYGQIKEYLETESDIRGRNYSISKRSLQRDIKDIYEQLIDEALQIYKMILAFYNSLKDE